MTTELVPDDLSEAIGPLLPCHRPSPRGGRPRVSDRAVLGGLVHLLRTGVPWRFLPTQRLGCGSPTTCWWRLRDWQQAGVWEALHHRLLDWLGEADQVDWARASIDRVSVRGPTWGN